MHVDTRHLRTNGVGFSLGTDYVEGARCEDGDNWTRVVRPGSGCVASEVGDGALAGYDERVTACLCQTRAEDGVPARQLGHETIDARQFVAPHVHIGHFSYLPPWGNLPLHRRCDP